MSVIDAAAPIVASSLYPNAKANDDGGGGEDDDEGNDDMVVVDVNTCMYTPNPGRVTLYPPVAFLLLLLVLGPSVSCFSTTNNEGQQDCV